jgi:Tol biopolymer transport system component
MWRLIFALLVVVLASTSGREQGITGSASESQQVSRGLLAYLSQGDLWFVREDGSDRRRLTNTATVDWFAWSPRGSDLVFTSWGGYPPGDANRFHDGRPADGLFLIALDGGSPRRVTAFSPNHYYSPPQAAWSPNGTAISFADSRANEVIVVDRLSGDVRRFSIDPPSTSMLEDERQCR